MCTFSSPWLVTNEVPKCCISYIVSSWHSCKALRLLEVKEEKVARREEYPQNGISVPGPCEQQCVVLHTFVLGFKIARGAVCAGP